MPEKSSAGNTGNIGLEEARNLKMEIAWRAYYGELERPLKVRGGQPDDNVYLNLCRLIVDKGVSFLFGTDITFDLPRGTEPKSSGTTANSTTSETTPEQDYIDKVWKTNRKGSFLQRLAINGGVCGHAFLRILPSSAMNIYPRLVLLDPSTVQVRWEQDDFEMVTQYAITWEAADSQGEPVKHRQLIYRSGILWEIADQVSLNDKSGWLTKHTEIWPYVWAPVFACQNLPAPTEYWGIRDLESDVIQMQKNINLVLSNISRILRYHAHPKTWGRGFDANSMRTSPDEITILPMNGELANLEMTSDLASSIEFYRRIKEGFHEIARVPEIATSSIQAAGLGQISGVALQIMYQSLAEKTNTKRRLYGDMLESVCQALLELGGFAPQEVTIQWPHMLPHDNFQEAQTALLYEEIGVSKETLLERLGFDPEKEAIQKAEEKEKETTQQAAQFNAGNGAVGAGYGPVTTKDI